MNDSSTLIHPQITVCREAYDYYRDNRRVMAKGIDQYNYWVKAINGIFELLKKMILETQGGVYIEGFGYFCHIRNPEKKVRKRKLKNSLIRTAKPTKKYIPYFEPDIEFKGWTMNFMFSKEYMADLKSSTIEYKLNFDLANTMRVAKDFAIKTFNKKNRGDKPYEYKGLRIKKIYTK